MVSTHLKNISHHKPPPRKDPKTMCSTRLSQHLERQGERFWQLPEAANGRRQIDGSQVKVSLQGAVLLVKDYLGNDDGFSNNLSLRELRDFWES